MRVIRTNHSVCGVQPKHSVKSLPGVVSARETAQQHAGPGSFMDILAAIKREERKLEKQLKQLQYQLDGVRAAAKAIGHSAEGEVVGAKKRVLSAAGRAAISRAAKKRWAKVRAKAKKVAA